MLLMWHCHTSRCLVHLGWMLGLLRMKPEHLHPGGYTPSVEYSIDPAISRSHESHLPQAYGLHSDNMGVRQGHYVVLTHA